MSIEVVMPQMGETVLEGTVNTWHRSAGDQVTEGEPLLEIGTDKVDTDIPAPASGTLAEISVGEGKRCRCLRCWPSSTRTDHRDRHHLPRSGRQGHRPGDAADPIRRVPRRGRRRGGRRVQGHRGTAEEFGPTRVRDTPDQRAGHPRRGHGRGHDRAAPDRRDHVQRLLRRLLGSHRQRDREEPLHVRRAGLVPAGHPLRERGRRAVRRAALAVGGELGHGRARAQGRGARPTRTT